MNVRLFVVISCIGCASATPPPPEAPPYRGASNADCQPNPHLSVAHELYDELRFDETLDRLQRAIEHPMNCPEDVLEIYRLKAYVDAITDQPERCRRDFEIIHSLRVDWQLPADAPPKVRRCYEAVVP